MSVRSPFAWTLLWWASETRRRIRDVFRAPESCGHHRLVNGVCLCGWRPQYDSYGCRYFGGHNMFTEDDRRYWEVGRHV